MIGFIYYGKPKEDGSRCFVNVLVRAQKHSVGMAVREDQRKPNGRNFKQEEEFLRDNPFCLELLLSGKTVYL